MAGYGRCHSTCERIEFKEQYEVKYALGKAYKEIIPENDTEKNYRDGYHFCPICHIYIRNFEGVWCPCCGWKTRVARKNVRGKMIAKKYRLWAGTSKKLGTTVRNDIQKNLKKWEALLSASA